MTLHSDPCPIEIQFGGNSAHPSFAEGSVALVGRYGGRLLPSVVVRKPGGCVVVPLWQHGGSLELGCLSHKSSTPRHQ